MSQPHEELITRAHIAIFNDPHWCWLTQVILLGKVHIVDVIENSPMQTAGTDCYNVWYAKPFIDHLFQIDGEKAIRTLVLHENLHKALRHNHTWKQLDLLNKQKSNYAQDAVINNIVVEKPDFCSSPKLIGGVWHPEFAGLSVGEVWDKLPEGTGGSQDMHFEFGEGELTDEEGVPLTPDQIDTLVQAAVQQGIFLQRGRDPSSADRFAKLVEAKIDWKDVLREWMSQRTWGYDLANWKRPSRRGQSIGVALPTRYDERCGRLAIGVDVSGSISQQQLGEFLGEVASLCNTVQPVQVDIAYWDGAVGKVETYRDGEYSDMGNSFAPQGGGGTTLGCFVDWLDKASEPYTAAIVFTDGYIESWHENRFECDVLVVLNSNVDCPLTHVRL